MKILKNDHLILKKKKRNDFIIMKSYNNYFVRKKI